MEITFNRYIDNPMGKKNAVFSQRDMFKKLYTEKLDKIILREASKFNYRLFYDSAKDRYFCHIKVPSEVIDKFYYDTVIMFYSNDPTAKGRKDLRQYYVKFYSNDPAFVYTFAHAFIKNEIFIEELVPKMTKRAVKDVAKEKNPENIVGYVKSIYFAYLIMLKYSLFEKANYSTQGKKFTTKELLSDVMDASKKVALRQEEGEKLLAAQKRERIKAANNNRNNEHSVSKANTISPIKKTSTVSKIGSTKIVKPIKKK